MFAACCVYMVNVLRNEVVWCIWVVYASCCRRSRIKPAVSLIQFSLGGGERYREACNLTHFYIRNVMIALRHEGRCCNVRSKAPAKGKKTQSAPGNTSVLLSQVCLADQSLANCTRSNLSVQIILVVNAQPASQPL